MSRRKNILAKIRLRCDLVENATMCSPCWVWTGPDSGKPGRGRAKGRGHSYPRMTLDGCTMAVHRVTWQCVHGPLSPRRQLDHLCETRRCVSPLHLDNTTHLRNQKRRDERRATKEK